MATKPTKKPARSRIKVKSADVNSVSNKNDTFFGRFARKVATICGNPATFLIMLSLVIVWALSGPVFDYSETWQLVINTSTTIITFLMVFVIQNTQNKDTQAMQLKLDELIRANSHAHNALMVLEELSQEELDAVKCTYIKLAEDAREHSRKGELDDAKPEAEDLLNPENNNKKKR